MSSTLTEEQKKKIEENRLKALARRAEKLAQQSKNKASGASTNPGPVHQSSDGHPSAPKILAGESSHSGCSAVSASQQSPHVSHTEVRAPQVSAGFHPDALKPRTAMQQRQEKMGSAAPVHISSQAAFSKISHPVTQDSLKSARQQNSGRLAQGPTCISLQSKPAASASSVHGPLGEPGHSRDLPTAASGLVNDPGRQSLSTTMKFSTHHPECQEIIGHSSSNRNFSDSGGQPDEKSGKLQQATQPSPRKAFSSQKGKCTKVGGGRFQVEIGYNSELLAVFKSLPSRKYDPATKTWDFSLKDYKPLMKAVQHLRTITLLPLEGLETTASALKSSSSESTNEMPPQQLQPHSKGLGSIKGRCVLISRTRFEVDIGFSEDVIGIFKQMASRKYGKFAALIRCEDQKLEFSFGRPQKTK